MLSCQFHRILDFKKRNGLFVKAYYQHNVYGEEKNYHDENLSGDCFLGFFRGNLNFAEESSQKFL